MVKRLNFNKNYNLFFLASCLIGMIVFSGCGKDDKEVTQNIMPDSIKYGGLINSTYINARPINLTVGKSDTIVKTNVIAWEAPSAVTGTGTLIGYKIYSSGPDKQGFFSVSSKTTTIFETTNTTSGYTYTFRVTSIFSFFDTAYNYFTEIESLPSDAYIIDR